MPYTSPNREKLLSAFTNAPESVKEALDGEGVAITFFLSLETTYKISHKISNPITEMGRDVLIGLLQPIDFDTYLRELVGKDTADKILKDFNTKVLFPLLSGKNDVRKPTISVGEILIQNKKEIAAPEMKQGSPVPVTVQKMTPVTPAPIATKTTAIDIPHPAPFPVIQTKSPTSVNPPTITKTPESQKGHVAPTIPVAPPQKTIETIPTVPATTPIAIPIKEGSLVSTQSVPAPVVPNLTKSGLPAFIVPTTTHNAPSIPKLATLEAPLKVTAPNATPLINKYTADPYRESPEIDK